MEVNCWHFRKQRLKMKEKNHLIFLHTETTTSYFNIHTERDIYNVSWHLGWITPEVDSEWKISIGIFYLGRDSRKHQYKPGNVSQGKQNRAKMGAVRNKLLIWALVLHSTRDAWGPYRMCLSCLPQGQESWGIYPPTHLFIFSWGTPTCSVRGPSTLR